MKSTAVAYLASYVLSILGNSVAAIALPLIVLQTTGSVMGAGALAAATALPAFVGGLTMGALLDRVNRRTASIVSDLISAVAIAALPLIDLAMGLHLGWFIAFGIIGSFGDVPGLTARETLIPAVVRASGVTPERLIGLKESLGAVAMLVGPAAAGTLMWLFSGWAVLWVTAGTSLSAALLTCLMPRSTGAILPDAVVPAPFSTPASAGRQSPEGDRRPTEGAAGRTLAGGAVGGIGRGVDAGRGAPDGADGQTPVGSAIAWGGLREGWRALVASRFLMAVTSLTLISVVVLGALQALVLPVYFVEIGKPGLVGYVLSSLAAGMLVGAGVYAAVGSKGSRRAWLVAGLMGSAGGFGLMATLVSPGIVFVGAAGVGIAIGSMSGVIGVVTLERIPERLRGRILGTQNSLATLVPAIGVVGAALLTRWAGVQVAAAVVAALWLAAVVAAVATPALRDLRRVPGVSLAEHPGRNQSLAQEGEAAHA
ncbi:MAG: MFS transporter [Bifidobacteriaceae bacterium]|jgi:MFS family permease|nr:MFS transporter [Bifidobacteriaceae bacterium]